MVNDRPFEVLSRCPNRSSIQLDWCRRSAVFVGNHVTATLVFLAGTAARRRTASFGRRGDIHKKQTQLTMKTCQNGRHRRRRHLQDHRQDNVCLGDVKDYAGMNGSTRVSSPTLPPARN